MKNLSNIEVTDLTYSVTDLTDGDGNVIPADSVTVDGPASIDWKAEAEAKVTVSVPDDQPAGTYEGTVTVIRGGVDTMTTMILRVTVTREEAVAVEDKFITGEENITVVDSIKIKNMGNCKLGPVHVVLAGDLTQDGKYNDPTALKIAKENVQFIPNVIEELDDDAVTYVKVKVTIPKGTIADTFKAPVVIHVGSEEGEVAGEATLTVVVQPTERATQIMAVNNPVLGGKAVIRYLCDAGYKPTITLVNMAGEKVLEKELDGSGVYTWDLKDEDGKEVASGVYLVFLKTKVNGTEKVLRYKLFIVR